MANKNNSRSKIWLYAVVLFTSAFIVLLLTAYSQIKLNKNLSELNNQISSKENEKNQVQLSFANAQEINNKLAKQNGILQDEKSRLINVIDQLQVDLFNSGVQEKAKAAAYDKLCQAQTQYMDGDAAGSAQTLEGVDANLLDGNGSLLYSSLKNKAYSEAGRLLLNDGYKLYLDGEYSAAIQKLALSYKYVPAGDSSGKCLYYLAKAEYKSGDKTAGIISMKSYVSLFPQGKYIRGAKNFLSEYGG